MVTSIDHTRLRLTAEDGSDGVLLGTRCGECGVYSFGPAVMCLRCTSASLEEVSLSAHGSLYSYTLVHVPPAGWPGPVPYILGQVELPEGPHIMAEVVDASFEELKVGIPMTLALRNITVPDTGPDTVEQKAVYKWRVDTGGTT